MELRTLLRRHWFIVLVIFLLVFSVGLRFLSAGLMHYDSVRLAQTIESNLETGTFQGISAGGRYGMVVVASAVYYPFFLAGQNADLAVRLTGVLMLALSAVAVYLLTFEISRSRFAGVAAALLMAATPLFIIPATYGKEHTTAVFFLVMACYCALRGHRSYAALWPIAASFLFVFSLTVRETFVLALPVFVLFVLYPRLRRTEGGLRVVWHSQWHVGVVSLVVFLALVGGLFFGAQLRAVLGDRDATALSWSLTKVKAGISDVARNGRFVWPLYLIGIVAVWRSGRDFLAPLLVWVAPFFIIVNAGGYLPRLLDVVLVPLVIIAGFGLAFVWARSLVFASLVLLALVLSTFWTALPFLELRHNENTLQDIAGLVANVTEPNALIIAMDESAFLEYYGSRQGTSVSPNVENRFEVARWIVSLQRNGTPLYVLQSSFDYPDGLLLRNFLYNNFDTTVVGARVMENYHDAEAGVLLRNVSIIRIGAPKFDPDRMGWYEVYWRGGIDTTEDSQELAAWLAAGLS